MRFLSNVQEITLADYMMEVIPVEEREREREEKILAKTEMRCIRMCRRGDLAE